MREHGRQKLGIKQNRKKKKSQCDVDENIILVNVFQSAHSKSIEALRWDVRQIAQCLFDCMCFT